VLIATTYSNRPPGTENLVGYFLRLLLLRNRVLEGDTFCDVIKREMATLTGAMENAMLPVQDVVRLCSLPRTPGASNIFQALVTWDEEGECVQAPVAKMQCRHSDLVVWSLLQSGSRLSCRMSRTLVAAGERKQALI